MWPYLTKTQPCPAVSSHDPHLAIGSGVIVHAATALESPMYLVSYHYKLPVSPRTNISSAPLHTISCCTRESRHAGCIARVVPLHTRVVPLHHDGNHNVMRYVNYCGTGHWELLQRCVCHGDCLLLLDRVLSAKHRDTVTTSSTYTYHSDIQASTHSARYKELTQ